MLQLSPQERAEPLVQALVDAYRRSQHGRTGNCRREFNIRYDKLVHKLACANFVEEKRGRAILERMRLAGLIRWDHIPLQRDQIKTIYIAPTAENELFEAVGETPPAAGRTDAVSNLADHLNALNGHCYEIEWKMALQQAIADIAAGRSAEGLPNNANLHDEILCATAAVLNNQKSVPIRRLSAEKLGNSKLLQRRQETVERFMAHFLPPDLATLEAWKVADTPPTVLLRGPLGIVLDDGTDVPELASGSPYTIREEVLARAHRVFTSSTRCLSIENHTTFQEMVAINADALIVHTSYPSSSVVKLLRLLPPTVQIMHWGDTDPWGYDILRVLRERIGRPIAAWRMTYRPRVASPSGKFKPEPLSRRDSAVLSRLVADPLVADVRSELMAIQAAGNKGDFEQESLPLIDF